MGQTDILNSCTNWRAYNLTLRRIYLSERKTIYEKLYKELVCPRASLVDYDTRKISSPLRGIKPFNLVSVPTELQCSLFNDAVRNLNVHNVNNLKIYSIYKSVHK